MPAYAPRQALARVVEAKKRDLRGWNEGLHLERSTGRSIEDLRQRSTADRWKLADQLRLRGNRMMEAQPPLYRDAVSRFYYSMYHAMRAVVFYTEGGDDHEQHTQLPGSTPSDFEDSPLWQNTLKDARERRNAVDYEPYPKSERAHRPTAVDLQGQANDLVRLARSYLQSKGCAHL